MWDNLKPNAMEAVTMNANFNGEVWTIPTSRPFTADELFELMTDKGNFGGVKPELKKVLGMKTINLPGAGGFYNAVGVTKKSISISQFKSTGKGLLKSMAIDTLTDGWGSLLNIEGGSNAPVMKAIAEEIERLVTENA